MKTKFKLTLLTVLAVFALWLANAAPGSMKNAVVLMWDYPTNAVTVIGTNTWNSDPDVFVIYSSTNATAPLITWPKLTTVDGSARSLTLPVTSFERYFTITASNYIGESSFSNVERVPASPSHPKKVRLQ